MGIALMPLLGAADASAQFINRFNCPANAGVRCGDTNLVDLFNTIINYALGIAFFVAVIFLIYGGFLYITSAGNEETATKGKYFQGVPVEKRQNEQAETEQPIPNFHDFAGSFGNCRLEGSADFRSGKKPEAWIRP